MPDMTSSQKWLVRGLRWIARVISVLWGYAAVLLILFLAANYHIEGFFSSTVAGLIMAVALVLFMGAAILASVWGQEAIGGGLLLFDGVVWLAALVIGLLPHMEMSFTELLNPSTPSFWLVTPIVWAPIVAGVLFLACYFIPRQLMAESAQEQPPGPSEEVTEDSADTGSQT